MQFEQGKVLSELTTFGLGGPAQFFIEVATIAHMQEVIQYCYAHNLRFFPLGKGSNVLFDDRGFDGVVILNKISFCDEKEGEFYVGAGYSFSLLGTQTARKGWAGLEFASGIPCSVGGAIYMNAGANGGETYQTLKEVTFINEKGELEILPKEVLVSGYRFSLFQQRKGVIVAGRFQLQLSQEARSKQLKIIDYRTKTQPYGEMSAGCVFRNPPNASAGQLIESSGLKAFKKGGAQVSPLHANFIVNTGSATTQDVIELALHVRQVVKEKTGIELEMEVKVIPYQDEVV